MHKQIHELLVRVMDLLIQMEYDELAELTNGVRLSSSDMRRAIGSYGQILVKPPENEYSLINIVEVNNVQLPTWAITMSVWTMEEGRSDLSLEATVIENGTEFKIELDNIHVL